MSERDDDIRKQWKVLEDVGKVRLHVVPDECSNFDDLAGDTYNPEANPDIPVEQLAKEKAIELRRIENEGIYGVIGEYKCKCCGQWVQADAVWGFVGDDWKDSGYDVDIMSATLQKHNAQ